MATMPAHRTTSAERGLVLDANERAWSLSDGEWVAIGCECGRAACPETAQMPRLAYERVRSSGASYIVVPGHERLGTERVTELDERYAVVQGTREGTGKGPR
jgi:hypothetical protein